MKNHRIQERLDMLAELHSQGEADLSNELVTGLFKALCKAHPDSTIECRFGNGGYNLIIDGDDSIVSADTVPSSAWDETVELVIGLETIANFYPHGIHADNLSSGDF